jgi:anion-transporting  ArsA/GET3 family ATPase
VSGKGGVGRTTVALILGRALAARSRRVLVATTGHDDRLAWLCGQRALGSQATEVTGVPGLFVQRLNPSVCVREYAELVLHSRALAQTVFDNRVVKKLLSAVPGLDDFAVLGKVWHEAARERRYDCVVFDGPASGHLPLTLGVPKTIRETISSGPLVREAVEMDRCLRDASQTAAVLVSLAQQWPLTELAELALRLQETIGLHSAALVINKVWPANLPELLPPPASLDDDGEVAKVFALISDLAKRGQQQSDVLREWLASPAARSCPVGSFLSVPWWPQGFDDAGAIDELIRSVSLVH